MTIRTLTLAAVAALTLAPAAWSQTPAEPAPAAAAAAKAGPAAGVAAPPAGKAQIVFFRPGRFIGAAVGYKLSEGEAKLGKVSNGRYLVVTVEPGTHTFVMDFGTKGDMRMEAEPDETYYVECGLQMGALLNHPNLIPSTKEEFERFASKGKPQKAAD